jgi:glycosyltransferase involved in cell wall biosynthesis
MKKNDLWKSRWVTSGYTRATMKITLLTNEYPPFSRDLAGAANSLFSSPEKLKKMGIKARERVVGKFGWRSIAQQTFDFYRTLTQDS